MIREDDKIDLNNKVEFLKNISFISLSELFFRLRGLFFLPIFVKLIGIDGYGIWTQTYALVSILAPIFSMNISSALVRFASGEEEKEKLQEHLYSIFILALGLGLLGGGVVYFFSSTFASLFIKIPGSDKILQIAALFLVSIIIYSVTLDFLRSRFYMLTFTILRTLTLLFDVALILIALLNGKTLALCFWILILNRFLVVLGVLIWSYFHLGFTFPRFKYIKDYISYSLPQSPALLFRRLLSTSDRLIIGYFWGGGMAGIYNACRRLAELLVSLYEPIRMVMAPTIMKLWDKGKKEEVKSYMSLAFRISYVLTVPLGLLFSIVAYPLLELMTSIEFAKIGAPVVPLVVIASFLDVAYRLFCQSFRLIKKIAMIFYSTLAGAILNILLNFILVPKLGIWGAAYTTILGFGLALLITLPFSIRILRFAVPWNYLFKYVIAASLSSLIPIIFPFMNKISFLFLTIFFFLFYLLLLFLVGGLGKEEKEFVQALWHKFSIRLSSEP